MSNLGIFEDGGFIGHNRGPHANAPRDWLAWHFTLAEYLPEIFAEGALCCDDVVPERVGSVANQEVKARRRSKIVAADGYALDRPVSAHVPFYFAAKSPMLFVVGKEYSRAKLDSLVFLGVTLGDVQDSRVDWVASDGNAAAGVTGFSTDMDGLAEFVDFELLKSKWWNDTPDDMDRKRRRAAEFLVHDRVPLSLVSQVVARNDATLATAQDAFERAGHSNIDYRQTDIFFY